MTPAAHAAPQGTASMTVVQALPGQSGGRRPRRRPGGGRGRHRLRCSARSTCRPDSTRSPSRTPSGEVLLEDRRVARRRAPARTWSCTCRPRSAATRSSRSTRRRASPSAPSKARVLIAHTASVAPADVRVDGAVVFTNIANGEFAVADVAGRRPRRRAAPVGPDHAARSSARSTSTCRPDGHDGLRRGRPEQRLDGGGRAQHLPHRATDAGAGQTIDTGSAGLAARTCRSLPSSASATSGRSRWLGRTRP